MNCTTAVGRHSYSALKLTELVQGLTWTGSSMYLAPTITELVPDTTRSGATDRLHY